MERFGVYRAVSSEEALREGWPTLPVRWVVQQRGPKKWRCRLVGKEFVASGPDRRGLFMLASTMNTTRILDFLVATITHSQ